MDGHEPGNGSNEERPEPDDLADVSVLYDEYRGADDDDLADLPGGEIGSGGEVGFDDEEYRALVRKIFSAVVVAACCIYIFWVAHPELIFRNTTPTGGDMGAHVWGPAYLRDELLPNFRVTGWTDDWYAGFPAYTFYMVIPSLMIVLLDVGVFSPDSVLGFIGMLLVVGAAGTGAFFLRKHSSRLVRFLGWSACIIGPLLIVDLPYNIAFKVIAVSGIVAFPAGVWYLLSGLSLRHPGPELGAVISVAFLMDKSLFHIYGGNVASTMAGEFAFSISITLALFALGAIARGIQTGRYRVRASILVALAMLCHVIPGLFFLGVGAVLMVALRPRLATLKWALPVGLSGGLMAMWWYLPFYGRSAYLNDMGWEKLGVALPTQSWARLKVVGVVRGLGATVLDKTSCDAQGTVIKWTEMWRNLLPFAPHDAAGTIDSPNMWNGKLFFILAGVGVVLSLVMVVRSGIWLTMLTLLAGAAFIVMPQDRFWNARVLPFYYLGIYLLGAVGVALTLRALVLVFRGRWADPPPWLSMSVTGVAVLLLAGALGMTLRTNPGGEMLANTPDGVPTYSWLYWQTTYQGPVRDWAKWNFEGLESKPGCSQVADPVDIRKTVTKCDDTKSQEYFNLMAEMRDIGRTEGCGRAYWEYDDALLGAYGTPMAPMLIPYFTDHCIGSMEGLYFEASSTTPFHFLVQSELSQAPSRPERFDCHLGFEESPYQSFNIDQGIKHLQMLGVKYFMALTDLTKQAAQAAAKDGRLTLVGGSGPWQVYEVADVDLVEPLDNLPVVWDDVHDDIYTWARPSIDWFNDESQWDVLRASSGPADWARVGKGDKVTTTKAPAPNAKVSNIEKTAETISFDVSEVGTPVLIRTSYFPNWKAEGAGDVYRVTPNFMVVVPTEKHVTLTYTRAPMELFSLLLSVLGALILFSFLVWTPKLVADRGREFFGDREPLDGRAHDEDGDDDDFDEIDHDAHDGPGDPGPVPGHGQGGAIVNSRDDRPDEPGEAGDPVLPAPPDLR